MYKIMKALKSNESLRKAVYYSGLYLLLDLLFDQKGVYILCYHRLSDTDRDSPSDPMTVDYRSFEKHLEYLKRKYIFITMDQAVELLSQKKLRERYLVITFDDGYRDNYIYGQSIFEKFGVKPVIYLTAGIIDKRAWLWHDFVDQIVYSCSQEEVTLDTDIIKGRFFMRSEADRRSLAETIKESVKDVDEKRKIKILEDLAIMLGIQAPGECRLLLDWTEVRHLMESGADMGGHTLNHPILSRISDADMEQEVSVCKKLIEEHTGKKVRHFAYPNGRPCDYTGAAVIEVMKHYDSAVTTDLGMNKPGTDLYKLRRILIGKNMDIMKLRFRLLQAKLSQIRTKTGKTQACTVVKAQKLSTSPSVGIDTRLPS